MINKKDDRKRKDWEIQAEQTKQEMKDMVFNLAESYVVDPGAIAEFMEFSSKFYRYSARNSMLIFSQNRNASFVQSFVDWKKRGVHIRKGQKGMKIFVPVQKTFRERISSMPGKTDTATAKNWTILLMRIRRRKK